MQSVLYPRYEMVMQTKIECRVQSNFFSLGLSCDFDFLSIKIAQATNIFKLLEVFELLNIYTSISSTFELLEMEVCSKCFNLFSILFFCGNPNLSHLLTILSPFLVILQM